MGAVVGHLEGGGVDVKEEREGVKEEMKAGRWRKSIAMAVAEAEALALALALVGVEDWDDGDLRGSRCICNRTWTGSNATCNIYLFIFYQSCDVAGDASFASCIAPFFFRSHHLQSR